MRGKVKLSPILVFLLCLLVYRGWEREVGCFLAAATAHECGHLLALKLCGCTVQGISFGLGGAAIETGAMSDREALLCAAAGPLVNLTAMLLPFRTLFYCNFLLLLFNLLPIEPLDGGRMLTSLCKLFFPDAVRPICDAAAVFAAAVLLFGGAWCCRTLDYGIRPMAFVAGILIRACFFRLETVE